MDTTELEGSYRSLLDVARKGGFAPPVASGDWSAELVLAHVAATDRLLAAVTAEVLAGERGRFDNGPAIRTPHLHAIARAAGDWDGLVGEVRRAGLALVLLARDLGDAAAAPVDVRILEDGGGVRIAAPMPWVGVLATHAQVDLVERARQLDELRRAGAPT